MKLSTTVTLFVTDGETSVSTSFELTVRSVNDLPSISEILDQSIPLDGKAGPLSFTIGDVETAAASLKLAGGSSNPALVPIGNIVFGGSGANRTVTVTPAAGEFGASTITVTVTDAGASSRSETFLLTVAGPSVRPTLSILRSGENLVISWESVATGYLLQSSSSIALNSVWSTVNAPQVSVGARTQVTVPIGPEAKFVRLAKP